MAYFCPVHTRYLCNIFKLSFTLCLFGVYSPTREFFTHLEKSTFPVKGCKFDLCPALVAIKQWEFFSESHLLLIGASIYNGHLRGHMTLTLNAERLAAELSLPVLTTWSYCGWDSNTQPSDCGTNALTHCTTAAASRYATNVINITITPKNALSDRKQLDHLPEPVMFSAGYSYVTQKSHICFAY